MREMVTDAPGRMSMREVPMPVAADGQAVIDVAAVGLCGSDLHFFTGDHPYSRFPLVQGHEFSGWVRSLPDDYAGSLSEGDLVAVEPYLYCGTCYPCRHGRPNCCTRLQTLGAQVDGALRDTVTVDVSKLYPVPGLTPEQAALVEPVSIGAMAVSRAPVREGDQVLILGAGPIGQAILLSLADAGTEVAVADRLPSRLKLAGELGASLLIDTSSEDLDAAVDSWTSGDGPAVVFEATGVPALLRRAVALVAPSGSIVVVGLSTDEVGIPVVEFTRKELNIFGSRAGSFGPAVDLVTKRPTVVERLVSHRFPLEETADALRLAIDRPAEAEKVLILLR